MPAIPTYTYTYTYTYLPLPHCTYTSWFDVIYMDDSLRLCKDVRGDLQICTRR